MARTRTETTSVPVAYMLLLLLQNIGCVEESTPDISSAAWLRQGDGIARFRRPQPAEGGGFDSVRQSLVSTLHA